MAPRSSVLAGKSQGRGAWQAAVRRVTKSDAAEQLSAHTQVTENSQGLDRQPASSETQRRWLTPFVVSE